MGRVVSVFALLARSAQVACLVVGKRFVVQGWFRVGHARQPCHVVVGELGRAVGGAKARHQSCSRIGDEEFGGRGTLVLPVLGMDEFSVWIVVQVGQNLPRPTHPMGHQAGCVVFRIHAPTVRASEDVFGEQGIGIAVLE